MIYGVWFDGNLLLVVLRYKIIQKIISLWCFSCYIYAVEYIEIGFGKLIKDVTEDYDARVEGNERWDWEHIKERWRKQALAKPDTFPCRSGPATGIFRAKPVGESAPGIALRYHS